MDRLDLHVGLPTDNHSKCITILQQYKKSVHYASPMCSMKDNGLQMETHMKNMSM